MPLSSHGSRKSATSMVTAGVQLEKLRFIHDHLPRSARLIDDEGKVGRLLF